MNRVRAFRRWVRHALAMSIDLFAVVLLVALTNLVVFSPDVNGSLVRALLGIPFVLFAPGYALVSVLFPDARRSGTAGRGDEPGVTVNRFVSLPRDGVTGGMDGVERVALGFALSIALVPLLVVGLTATGIGFELLPIVATISAVTIASTGIAVIRRLRVPAADRFRVPYWEWIATGKRHSIGEYSRPHAVLNVALAVAIVLAVGTLTFAVLTPPDGEEFTEFYVLSEDGEGERFVTNQSDSLTPGEPEPVQLGIENFEEETVEYQVVVQLQRLEGDADESVTTDRLEVDRFSVTLAHNETTVRERELNVTDELTGEDLRLTFLLYEGSAPETPTRANAYRSLHLWVDVEAS